MPQERSSRLGRPAAMWPAGWVECHQFCTQDRPCEPICKQEYLAGHVSRGGGSSFVAEGAEEMRMPCLYVAGAKHIDDGGGKLSRAKVEGMTQRPSLSLGSTFLWHPSHTPLLTSSRKLLPRLSKALNAIKERGGRREKKPGAQGGRKVGQLRSAAYF